MFFSLSFGRLVCPDRAGSSVLNMVASVVISVKRSRNWGSLVDRGLRKKSGVVVKS